MEYVVLGLLMLRSLTLYELNKAFQQGVSLFYSASYGSLQFAVKKLLGGGFIEVEERREGGRNKKIYSITEKGRRLFLDWMQEGDIPANRLETVSLTKFFFLGLIERDEDKRLILLQILEGIRQAEEGLIQLDKQLGEYEAGMDDRGIFYYQLRSLNYGIRSHQFAKSWFEGALNDLDR